MGGVLRDFSEAALVGAIEGNIDALCASFAAIAGASVEDDSAWLCCTTGIAAPMFNCVARTRLSPDTIDAAIEAAIAHFRSRGVPMAFWWDGPACTPPDLGARLLAHGFTRSWDESPGLAIDLNALPADPPLPPDFTIEQVGDTAMLEVWGRTYNEVFESPAWVGESWVAATRAAGLANAPWHLYLACLGDRPVATVMLMEGAGVAGLYVLGTSPTARRQGIGAAITLAPLRDARARGYRVGILHSSPAGESLYRRLGFRQYCTLNRYLWVDPGAQVPGSASSHSATIEEG